MLLFRLPLSVHFKMPQANRETQTGRSWYKNNRIDGRVTATFAGSALLFQKMIENPRPEDFEIRYRARNRFRFMGNGMVGYELEEGSDLAWYVEM
jgi:hypothetical protein